MSVVKAPRRAAPAVVLGTMRLLVLTAMVLPAALALPMRAEDVTLAASLQTCRTLNSIPVCGRFLEAWGRQANERASTYVNGLPITVRRSEIAPQDGKSYETQWFERARFEAHPENEYPYDVLLGLLGAGIAEGRGGTDPGTKVAANPADQAFVGVDRPAVLDNPEKLWFPETRHSVSGKFLDYWRRYGGLPQFGFPLSEPFAETSATDGKLYTVQYFERNRFELHPEKTAPYDVELGLLGVEQYKRAPVPAEQLPISPPRGVTSKKDSVIIASYNEPSNLTFDGYTFAKGFLDAEAVALDDRENMFPWLVWYVPTIENGGAFFAGSGEDRHLVVKYKIRPGVLYSDGVEITSSDFTFAYKYMMRPDNPSDESDYLKLASVENPDRYTVLYRYRSYKQAQAVYDRLDDSQGGRLVKYFADHKLPVVDNTYSIVGGATPEHVLKDVPPDVLQDSTYAHEGYIGTGPYRIESWTKGHELVLVQNDNYTLTARPLLKRITFRFISDQAEILKQLKAGDVDATLSNAFPTPIKELDALGPGMVVDTAPGSAWEHVDFHYSYPPFAERAVREAIITAINRQRIADQVYLSRTSVLNTATPAQQWYSLDNPDFAKHYPEVAARWKVPVYPYDPSKAARILDAAGWMVGPDGVRTRNGTRLEFELAATNVPLRKTITGLIQADLKAVGINASLKYYSSDEYFGWNGVIDQGQCKMCEYAWGVSPFTGFDGYQSSEIPDEQHPGGNNVVHYRNPRIDELGDLLFSDVSRNVQAQYAAEAQVILMQDVAMIPLFSRIEHPGARQGSAQLPS